MSPHALLRHFKKKSAIAKAGKTSKQRVSNWFKAGEVPIDMQMHFEVFTGGQLKADVSESFREVVAKGEGVMA